MPAPSRCTNANTHRPRNVPAPRSGDAPSLDPSPPQRSLSRSTSPVNGVRVFASGLALAPSPSKVRDSWAAHSPVMMSRGAKRFGRMALGRIAFPTAMLVLVGLLLLSASLSVFAQGGVTGATPSEPGATNSSGASVQLRPPGASILQNATTATGATNSSGAAGGTDTAAIAADTETTTTTTAPAAGGAGTEPAAGGGTETTTTTTAPAAAGTGTEPAAGGGTETTTTTTAPAAGGTGTEPAAGGGTETTTTTTAPAAAGTGTEPAAGGGTDTTTTTTAPAAGGASPTPAAGAGTDTTTTTTTAADTEAEVAAATQETAAEVAGVPAEDVEVLSVTASTDTTTTTTAPAAGAGTDTTTTGTTATAAADTTTTTTATAAADTTTTGTTATAAADTTTTGTTAPAAEGTGTEPAAGGGTETTTTTTAPAAAGAGTEPAAGGGTETTTTTTAPAAGGAGTEPAAGGAGTEPAAGGGSSGGAGAGRRLLATTTAAAAVPSTEGAPCTDMCATGLTCTANVCVLDAPTEEGMVFVDDKLTVEFEGDASYNVDYRIKVKETLSYDVFEKLAAARDDGTFSAAFAKRPAFKDIKIKAMGKLGSAPPSMMCPGGPLGMSFPPLCSNMKPPPCAGNEKPKCPPPMRQICEPLCAPLSVDMTFFADGACTTPFAGTPKSATAESGKCVDMKMGDDGAVMKVLVAPKKVVIGLNATCETTRISPDLNCMTDGSECCPISGSDGFLFAYKTIMKAPPTTTSAPPAKTTSAPPAKTTKVAPETSGGTCAASTMFVAAATTGVLLQVVV
ncbi:EGF-like domain-containing protein [Pycnococcus provasolii]